MLYQLQSYVVQNEKWYGEMVSGEGCGNNNCGLFHGLYLLILGASVNDI
jgi:hypothetical protein